MSDIINNRGCLEAGEAWLSSNLYAVAGTAVGIAFLQVSLFYLLFYTNLLFYFYACPFMSFINAVLKR